MWSQFATRLLRLSISRFSTAPAAVSPSCAASAGRARANGMAV
jgi:hypothetical protein